MDSTALGINTSSIINSGGAASALAAIDTAITRIADKLAALGSVSKRIEIQSEFSSKLVDILKEGVGSLVDADLASESATLQALQIQQQLGVQARWLSQTPDRRPFWRSSNRKRAFLDTGAGLRPGHRYRPQNAGVSKTLEMKT